MCIALLSTAHPSYSLILLDNRDEFLNRPTAPAAWWPEPADSSILGGRDLLRSVHGTWLGVSKQGRIAVLTNFKEEGVPAQGLVSRGAIIRTFLTGSHTDTEAFIREMIASGVSRGAGGFSLICGKVGEPLAVMSNRAASETQIPWIQPGMAQTIGLSNAAYGDRSWEKVARGEELLTEAVEKSLDSGESEDDFIERLLQLLSTDTMPPIEEGGDLNKHLAASKKTIFVPVLGRPNHLQLDGMAAGAAPQTPQLGSNIEPNKLGISGPYGTQKQTVVLVEHSGRVRFLERTVHDVDGRAVEPGEGDKSFTFDIEE